MVLLKNDLKKAVDGLSGKLTVLSRWMYENPELGFQEYRISKKLINELEAAGFEVERSAAGKETAFVARYGKKGAHPAVAVFAEYDALPDIGHACGHNIIGTSALGAALALAKVWPSMPGCLYFFGSPGEEQSSVVNDCGGKVYLVNEGYLDDIDVALMIHPTNFWSAWTNNLAVQPLEMVFYGRSAQPAGSAHLGINAFEAAHLAYTNINACRQYFKPNFYVHGMITESGPAPNIMSPRSRLRLHVRAEKNDQLEELLSLVKRCGEAAALVTGAKVEFDYYMVRYKDVLNNRVVATTLENNMRELGLDVQPKRVYPRGSTDMGNVSYVVPSAHGYSSLGPADLVGNTHNPEFAPSTVSTNGELALLNAAKAMAMTLYDFLAKPQLVDEAWKAFRK